MNSGAVFKLSQGQGGPRLSNCLLLSQKRSSGPGQALVILRRCGPPSTSTSNSSPLGPPEDFRSFFGKNTKGILYKIRREAPGYFRALLGKIQRESNTNPARSAGKPFEGPFGQNTKEILYKIRREAAGNFGVLLGRIQRNP